MEVGTRVEGRAVGQSEALFSILGFYIRRLLVSTPRVNSV